MVLFTVLDVERRHCWVSGMATFLAERWESGSLGASGFGVRQKLLKLAISVSRSATLVDGNGGVWSVHGFLRLVTTLLKPVLGWAGLGGQVPGREAHGQWCLDDTTGTAFGQSELRERKANRSLLAPALLSAKAPGKESLQCKKAAMVDCGDKCYIQNKKAVYNSNKRRRGGEENL